MIYESIISKQIAKNTHLSESLMEKIEDKEIWKRIFADHSIHTLLQYYAKISSSPPHDSLPIFIIPTFQEYIDKMVNITSLGPSDYQRFIQSMKDPVFKDNMVTKYKNSIYSEQLKNHIVYIVRLYLLYHTKYSLYFTKEESAYLEETINMIPFFEVLSKQGWSLDELEHYEVDMDKKIDIDAYITIRNMFLQIV